MIYNFIIQKESHIADENNQMYAVWKLLPNYVNTCKT